MASSATKTGKYLGVDFHEIEIRTRCTAKTWIFLGRFFKICRSALALKAFDVRSQKGQCGIKVRTLKVRLGAGVFCFTRPIATPKFLRF